MPVPDDATPPVPSSDASSPTVRGPAPARGAQETPGRRREDPRVLAERAVACRAAGDDDGAMALFDQILRHHRGHRGALAGRIDIAVGKGDWPLALSCVDMALDALPETPALRLRRVDILRRLDRWADARSDLEALRAADPENPRILSELAAACRATGDDDGAADLFDATLWLRPDHRAALLGRIDIAVARADWAVALAHVDAALVVMPENLPLHLRRVEILRRLDRTQDAIQTLERLRAAHPDDPRVPSELAAARRAAGDDDAAADLFDAALRLRPDHRAALLGRIDIAVARGDWTATLAHVDAALAALPPSLPLRLRRVEALRHLDRPEEVLTELERLHESHPDDLRVLLDLAAARRAAGDEAGARSLFDAILDRQPAHRIALAHRIDMAVRTADWPRLLALVDAALAVTPDDLPLQIRRAETLRRLNRADAARSALERLHEAHPEDRDLRRSLLDLLRHFGDLPAYHRLADAILEASAETAEDEAYRIQVALDAMRFSAAREISEAALRRFPTSHAVHLARLRVLVSLRHVEAAWDLIRLMDEVWPNDPETGICRADELIAEGRIAEAIESLSALRRRHPEHVRIASTLLHLVRSDETKSATRRDLLEDIDRIGGRRRATNLVGLAKLARQTGAPGAGDEILAGALDAHRDLPRADLAWELIERGRKSEAFALIRHWIDVSDHDSRTVLQNSAALRALGPEAVAYLRDVQGRRPNEAARLIEALKRTLDGARDWLPSPNYPGLATAWRYADQSRYDFESWAERAVWGEAVERRFQEAIFADDDTGALDFLLERIDPPDLTPLHALTAAGRPFLLISTHLGVSMPLWLLSRIFPKLRYVALKTVPTPRDRLPFRPIVLDEYSAGGHRALLAALRDGCPIVLANDQRPEEMVDRKKSPDVRVMHFGAPHDFLPLVPKLAGRRGIPTFWMQGLHRDGRIVIELAPLPDPVPGEDDDAWARRWTTAFVRRLEGVMTGPPENVAPKTACWRRLTYVPPDRT